MKDKRAYITDQVSTIIGMPVDMSDTQVESFWQTLSREEERHAGRDVHGNFTPAESTLARLGLLEDPPLHAEIAALAQGCPETPPRWPDGYRFAACLTHDVDRIVKLPWRERWRQMVAQARMAGPRRALRWLAGSAVYAAGAALGRSDTAPYDAWIAEEERLGFRSTFFVLPERLAAPTVHDHYYRYRDKVCLRGKTMSFRRATALVAEAGWEIGLHGSYASAHQAEIFADEKVQVEAISLQPVTSVRQHYLRFDIDITPKVQAAAGMQADTTLGFSTTIGCRAGLAFPFFWPHVDLLEVPLIIQDVGLLRVHGSHLDAGKALARAQALITRVAEVGGVVTLSWHTHPESHGAHECYRMLLEMIAELGGWGCTLGQINNWWRARRAGIEL